MLGIQTSKQLLQSQSTRGLATLPADAFTMPSMLGNVEAPPPPPPPARKSETTHAPQFGLPPVMSAVGVVASDMDPSPNELTRDELKAVASGTLAYLNLRDPMYYVHHLATATLALGLAPRSQVLMQLRIGTSFVKEADGRWWVKMIGTLSHPYALH